MKISECILKAMIGLFFVLLYPISHILYYLDYQILAKLPLTGIWIVEVQRISIFIYMFFVISGWICGIGLIVLIRPFIFIIGTENNESKNPIFVSLSTGIILAVWDLFIAILPIWYYFPQLEDLFGWYINSGIDACISIVEIVILTFSMLYLRKVRIRVMYEERGNELPH